MACCGPEPPPILAQSQGFIPSRDPQNARLDECTSQWRACADLLNALDMKLAVHDPLGGVGASDFQEAMSRLLATQVRAVGRVFA